MLESLRSLPASDLHMQARQAKYGALIVSCTFKNFEGVRDFKQGM